MAEHKSLDYTMEKAKAEAQKAVDALAVLPESEYKQALISLAWLSVDRDINKIIRIKNDRTNIPASRTQRGVTTKT